MFGDGDFQFKEGVFYDGEWKNNKPHGEGTFIIDDEKYEGEWYEG